jgi:hypothetical protein
MCIRVDVHHKSLTFCGIRKEWSCSNGDTRHQPVEHNAAGWSAKTIPSSPTISRTLAKISVEWDYFMLGDIAFDCISLAYR